MRVIACAWMLVCSANGLAPAELVGAPTVVALVLDTSGSLSATDLDLARRLAEGIFESLPRGSQVAVLTFDDQARVLVERTSEPALVSAALATVRRSGRYTALHDALFDASRYVQGQPAERTALLLLTDGNDENSALNLEDGLKLATQAGIPVFCVGIGPRVDERNLRRIAKLTGGRYASGAEASSPLLASWIAEIPARPRDSAVPEPAPPAAAPAPVRPGRAWIEILLWTGLGAGLLTAAVALGLRSRARATGRCPACGGRLPAAGAPCPTCGSSPPPVRDRLEDQCQTVIARRDDGSEPAERTVVLAQSPLLAITRGARAGESVPLGTASATSIGRAPGNDLVIPDAAVSSQHCRIRPEAGRFVIHDLQSTNGTYVNERRVGRHALSEGDVIRLGDTWIEFRTQCRL